MNLYHPARYQRNIPTPEFSNPIIGFPVSPRAPTTAGGTYLVRRHHIRPELADLLAAAIGLGIEAAR
jgi:hypothetical protein